MKREKRIVMNMMNIAIIIVVVGLINYLNKKEELIEKNMDEYNFTLRHTKFWLGLGIAMFTFMFPVAYSMFRDYGKLIYINHFLFFILIFFLIGLYFVFYYFNLNVKIKDDQLTIRKNIFTKYTIPFNQITSIKIKVKKYPLKSCNRNIVSVFTEDKHHFSFDTKYYVGAKVLFSRFEKVQTIKFIW